MISPGLKSLMLFGIFVASAVCGEVVDGEDLCDDEEWLMRKIDRR